MEYQKTAKTYFNASDVLLAEQSNSQFLSVRMRMLSTRANRNKQGVTEAFIDEIMANQEKYMCTPLYADTGSLRRHNFDRLGHMYDRRSGRFLTDQIGSFCAFEKVNDEFGVSLYGEARVPKREADICEALMDMYASGNLNFSFEITYIPENTVYKDGTLYVDAAETNALTGMAVVSIPAYPEATALALVAQQNDLNETDENAPNEALDGSENTENKEVREMDKERMVAEPEEEEVVDTTLVAENTDPEAGDNTGDGAEDQTSTEEVLPDGEDEEEDEAKRANAEEAVATTEEVVRVDTMVDSTLEHVEEEDNQATAETVVFPAGGEVPAQEVSIVPPAPPAPAKEVHTTETVETTEEYHIRVTRLETIVAEKDAKIAELEDRMSDYEQMKAELETYREEAEKRERTAKIAKAEAWAKRQGLDIEDEAVKNAINEFNYEALADLVMASVPEEDETAVKTVSIVSEMKVPDDSYGGLISNR